MLALFLVGLFVVLPVAIGAAVPRGAAAYGGWLLVGAGLTLSQTQSDQLGGAWPLVAGVVVADLFLVGLGRTLRARIRATRARPARSGSR